MEPVAERYQIQERIPHGGPVELYRAVDTQLQRPVLLQILSEQAAGDEALCMRFRRHQQLAATVHHPSVQAVYDAGEWRGRPFSVLERDTGVPAHAVYQEGKAPDIRQAIAVTRQIAGALQFCRDAGLTDWPFSYRAVRVDSEGNARLALIGGLDYIGDEGEEEEEEGEKEGGGRHEGRGGYVSSRPADDPQALAALMRVLLTGSPHPRTARQGTDQLPPRITALLEKMDLTHEGVTGVSGAGEVAEMLAHLETSSEAPTEAHELAAYSDPQPTPAPLPFLHPSQQPTLEASALPDAVQAAPAPAHTSGGPGGGFDTAPMPVRRSRPTSPAVVPDTAPMLQDRAAVSGSKGRAVRFAGAVPLLGLLLAGLLLAVVVIPRLLSRPAPAEGATQNQTQAATATPSLLVVVPDLRGKTVDEAGALARTSGLQIGVAGHQLNADYPANTVADQTPQPGSYVQTGSTITVTVSLGGEPPPTVEQQQQQQQPPPPDHGKKEDEKKGKEKKGKDH
jgi:serine/threonine-protein kinase